MPKATASAPSPSPPVASPLCVDTASGGIAGLGDSRSPPVVATSGSTTWARTEPAPSSPNLNRLAASMDRCGQSAPSLICRDLGGVGRGGAQRGSLPLQPPQHLPLQGLPAGLPTPPSPSTTGTAATRSGSPTATLNPDDSPRIPGLTEDGWILACAAGHWTSGASTTSCAVCSLVSALWSFFF
jgi:hypothetical protein